MNSKWQLIAGPCSAETLEQVMETAKGLVPIKPSYFRAGIWKPRTRPERVCEGAAENNAQTLFQFKFRCH